MSHCLGLLVVVVAAAAAVVVVAAFAVQALVSISSLEGFLNSHWKCLFVVLLSVSAVQLLVAAVVAATDPAQCTGSKDLTRQFVRQSPD